MLKRNPFFALSAHALAFIWWVFACIAVWNFFGTERARWLVSGDAGMMHYVASMLPLGYLPYKDIFHFNMPGTYFIHRFCQITLGQGDVAFRQFDLIWLGLLAVFMAAFAWKASKFWALIAATTLVLYHFAMGSRGMLQRDFMMAALLIMAGFYVVKMCEKKLNGPMQHLAAVVAGLLMGLAIQIKPDAALWALFFTCWLLWRLRSWPLTLTFIFTCALPNLLIAWWLWEENIWREFIEVIYVFYGKNFSKLPARILNPYLHWQHYFILPSLVVFIVGPLVGFRKKDDGLIIVSVSIGLSLVHIFIQNKGAFLYYHFYPLFAWLSCGCALLLGHARQEKPRVYIAACSIIGSGLLLSQCVDIKKHQWVNPFKLHIQNASFNPTRSNIILTKRDMAKAKIWLGEKGIEKKPPYKIHFFEENIGQLWSVAYANQWRPSFRHIYAHALIWPNPSPYIKKIREEIITSLKKEKPDFIFLSPSKHPFNTRGVPSPYTVFERDPEIAPFMAENYRITAKHATYVLYTKITP